MTRRATQVVSTVLVASLATMVQAQQREDHVHTLSDGTELHYVEQGEGTPVILLHGAGWSAVGNWFRNGIASALAETNRVIAIDLRGHGETVSAPGGGFYDMPQDVLDLMDHLEIEKAHIAGYSMGGSVTLSILRSHPERFITASFGGSGIRETEEWMDKVPPDKEGVAPDEAKAREAFNAERAARARASQRSRFGRATRRLGTPPPPTSDPSERPDPPPLDLSKIDFPVLAINGEYDRPNAKTHRMWRELKNFTNVVLPDRGHLSAIVSITIPRQYIKSMVAFITSNNPE